MWRAPAPIIVAASSKSKTSLPRTGATSAAASSSGSKAHNQERRDAGIRNAFCKFAPVQLNRQYSIGDMQTMSYYWC